LIAEGKLKYKVHLHHGLEEAPKGLKNLLTGKNNGKVIVKLSPEHEVQAKL
jgi:NADPH-dependent curcumin reductase CurA